MPSNDCATVQRGLDPRGGFVQAGGMRVAITGGMGCGKSAAANLLEARGWRRLDSDRIVHGLLGGPGPVADAVAARFGPGLREASGGIDRAELGRRVFADPAALDWLEAELHPRVVEAWHAAWNHAPAARWIVEVPLLHEKSLESHFDLTVAVACEPAVQHARLEARQWDAGTIARRLARQLPTSVKAARSDIVLLNNSTPDFLEAQVDLLDARLR